MSNMNSRRKPSLFGISSPAWLCRIRIHIMDTLPKVYGPRGMVMLGFSMVSAGMGLAYVGPFASDTVSPGLAFVASIMPLSLWGVAWFLSAFTLATAAFRVDQSKALGGLTALLFVWSVSYMFGFGESVSHGDPNRMWLSSIVFLSLVIACMGVARMLNHAPSHPELIEKPGGTNE